MHSAKAMKLNREVIIISDDSESEKPTTSVVSRKLDFESTTSAQSITPQASVPLSSLLSLDNFLGRCELSSDSDSDSLNSSSFIIRFAHDVTKRQEVAQVLYALSNTKRNTSGFCSELSTREYTDNQL